MSSSTTNTQGGCTGCSLGCFLGGLLVGGFLTIDSAEKLIGFSDERNRATLKFIERFVL